MKWLMFDNRCGIVMIVDPALNKYNKQPWVFPEISGDLSSNKWDCELLDSLLLD